MLFIFPLHPDPDEAASPVVGWFCDEDGPNSFPAHSHRRAQLMHVCRGVSIVSTDEGVWVVPSHRALWIPPECSHSVHYPYGVSLRTLYFDVAALPVPMPDECRVFQLDPLARELMKTTAELPWDAALDGPGQRLVAVLLDRLSILPESALHLPLGQDKRLCRVMEALRADPADERGVEDFASLANCSPRTLTRLFLSETGMSLGAWRQQLRLQVALERLGIGEPVTKVAFDLGYNSPGNFSTMFRRALGIAPSEYFRERAE